MLTIAIRYLTGRAAAASVTSREEAEWPPHPGRLFMALVASWGTSGRSPQGQAALEWLEAQPPPSLHVPPAEMPDAVTFFVPVNDKKGGSLLTTNRKERHFPSALPNPDTVFFTWPEAEPTAEQRASIESLCANVTYLGRSSSLVQAWLADEAPPPTLAPADGASMRLRVAAPGRFAQLEARFQEHEFPDPGRWQGYRAVGEAVPRAAPSGVLAGDFLVLRRAGGPGLGLRSTLAVTAAFRGSVLAAAGGGPEPISGHNPSGEPTKRPHLAFVPLADVGHEHADGHLLGIAAIVPAGMTEAEREACINAVADASARPLVMGPIGEWALESEPPGESSRRGLDPSVWTRAAVRWATVTPVVLDRFPKADGDAEETIALACERTGLPRPRDVIVVPVSPLVGVPHAREFPPEPARKGKPQRWHTHAILTFDVPVAGPVLVGAGRFRGYGFCRPFGGS